MTASPLTPDICIIGAGAAGLSVATAAAAFGVPVVLIEQGKMGGQHLNTGCLPSKALLAASRRFADYAKAGAHMQSVIAAVAPNDSAQRLRGLGVQVIVGTARFTHPATVLEVISGLRAHLVRHKIPAIARLIGSLQT